MIVQDISEFVIVAPRGSEQQLLKIAQIEASLFHRFGVMDSRIGNAVAAYLYEREFGTRGMSFFSNSYETRIMSGVKLDPEMSWVAGIRNDYQQPLYYTNFKIDPRAITVVTDAEISDILFLFSVKCVEFGSFRFLHPSRRPAPIHFEFVEKPLEEWLRRDMFFYLHGINDFCLDQYEEFSKVAVRKIIEIAFADVSKVTIVKKNPGLTIFSTSKNQFVPTSRVIAMQEKIAPCERFILWLRSILANGGWDFLETSENNSLVILFEPELETISMYYLE